MTKKILISDPTLRDGNHAVRHQLSRENFIAYCKAAEAAGVPIVEVGHGNGLGASSLLVGECKLSDEEILTISRANLKKSKLAIHLIPGFCTIKSDLVRAVELGVDIFRVGSHCTEADITDRHIAYARNAGKEAYGVLMMSHMASPEILLEEAKKMESYGAEAIVIMDSAGAYFPDDVTQRISTLVDGLSIDGSIRGFGAGAGNTQLEVLVAVFERLGFSTGIDLYKILDAADLAEKEFNPVAPFSSPASIVSGLAGVFSGFSKQVARTAEEYQVDPRDIFFELGRRKAVAGQESLIIEVAHQLAAQNTLKKA